MPIRAPSRQAQELGIEIIPATAPDYFTEDTPTTVLVRQVLGAIAQFEKASAVANLLPPAASNPTQQGLSPGTTTSSSNSVPRSQSR